MKSKKLTIKINKPADEVFAFVTDPVNTPKWIDFIVKEQTSEMPPKLGTVYKNQNRAGEWSQYEMTAFEQDKMFILSNHGSKYHVRYTLTPLGKDASELEYYEWVDEGEVGEPFDIATLEKLKSIVEKLA